MKARKYAGQRVLRITARTVHIAAAAVVLGAAMWGHDALTWGGVLVGSGFVIVADDLYKYGTAYLRFAQAWAVIAKLALLIVGLAVPGWLTPSLFLALVVGSFISHAPGAIRHAPVWGRAGPCAGRAERRA